jgi:flagellar basal body rod protein FlgG
MSRDIYPSLSGATAAWQELQVVANNLANASTHGYREQRVSFEETMISKDPLANSYTHIDASSYNHNDGSLSHTGVDTDLALQGQGFMLAEMEDGLQVMVRGGKLQLDKDRFLITQGGDAILGNAGRIQLPENARPVISPEGVVTTPDGQEIDQIRLVTADELEPLGGTRWTAGDSEMRSAVGEVSIIQGSLEQSNSDPLRGMTQLIEASRYFEMYQKAMKTSDEMDARINEQMRG